MFLVLNFCISNCNQSQQKMSIWRDVVIHFTPFNIVSQGFMCDQFQISDTELFRTITFKQYLWYLYPRVLRSQVVIIMVQIFKAIDLFFILQGDTSHFHDCYVCVQRHGFNPDLHEEVDPQFEGPSRSRLARGKEVVDTSPSQQRPFYKCCYSHFLHIPLHRNLCHFEKCHGVFCW